MDGLRAYAFVGVFVAHAADGTISDDEAHRLQRNVHRAARDLGYTSRQAEDITRATMDEYARLLESVSAPELMGRFRREVQSLCDTYGADPMVLGGIQRDLRDIASADGGIADMEAFLIDHVAETWWRLRRN